MGVTNRDPVNLFAGALAYLPSGRPCVPPDLDALVSALDAEVRYNRTRRGFDGATDLSGPTPVIELGWVPASQSRSMVPWRSGVRLADLEPHHYDARTRFTLAHELGHILLHRYAAHDVTAARLSGQALERACDSLAAEILMPASWFVASVGQGPSLAALRRTAAEAGVSLSAALVRARALQMGVAGLFLSSATTTPTSSTELSLGQWRVKHSYGMRMNRPGPIGDGDRRVIDRVPLKAITTVSLTLMCDGHAHRLEGELRRTFTSAVLLAVRVDSCSVPAPRPWQCRSTRR